MEIPEEILRLVHRYLSGTATDDEKSALAEWLEASQSNREDFAALSAMRNASSALGGDDATDKMLSRLNARIDAEESGGIFPFNQGEAGGARRPGSQPLPWPPRSSSEPAPTATFGRTRITFGNIPHSRISPTTCRP